MASAAGLTQFEKDRQKRIEENAKRMAAIMQGVQTDLLVEKKKPKTAAKPKKRKAQQLEEGERRRSSRIGNLPAPLYYIEHDASDGRCMPKSRRNSTTVGRGCHGDRRHGERRRHSLAVGEGDDDDLFLEAPKGWKDELGCASLAAAEAATDAALQKQRELLAEGKQAFIKLMSASQVRGGFWCQLPIDIVPFYKSCSQRWISLHCLDKQHQKSDSFLYAVGGSSTSWPVVYLPKGGEGAGLSGGWRGFAIDMRLYPNDTVLFEVLDAAPHQMQAPQDSDKGQAGVGPGSSSGAAGTPGAPADSSSAADSGNSSDTATAAADAPPPDASALAGAPAEPAAAAAPAAAVGGVAPYKRMHMLAHIFRANSYEAEQPGASQVPDSQAAEDSQQQLPTTPITGPVTQGAIATQEAPAAAAAAAAAEDSDDDDDRLSLDVPLAKRSCIVPGAAAAAHTASAAVGSASGDDDVHAGGCASDQPRQQRQQQERDHLELQKQSWRQRRLSVAAQQQQLQLQLQSQQSEAASWSELSLMQAAETGLLRGVKIGRQLSTPARTPTAAAGEKSKGDAAACDVAVAASTTKKPKKRAAAAAAAAVTATVTTKAGAGAGCKGRPASQRVRKPKRWHGEAGGNGSMQQLVPKPADPRELVNPPTAEERAKDAAGGPFYVKQICGHQVEEGVDRFLVNWWGFGSWWDSWEEVGNLDAAPGSYSWKGGKQAIPAKFRV